MVRWTTRARQVESVCGRARDPPQADCPNCRENAKRSQTPQRTSSLPSVYGAFGISNESQTFGIVWDSIWNPLCISGERISKEILGNCGRSQTKPNVFVTNSISTTCSNGKYYEYHATAKLTAAFRIPRARSRSVPGPRTLQHVSEGPRDSLLALPADHLRGWADWASVTVGALLQRESHPASGAVLGGIVGAGLHGYCGGAHGGVGKKSLGEMSDGPYLTSQSIGPRYSRRPATSTTSVLRLTSHLQFQQSAAHLTDQHRSRD
jgi:hypothetical protein